MKQANAVVDKGSSIVVDTTPGLGDATTIADAIAMLPAEGGSLLLREGTFSLLSTVPMPDKPVVIKGCGDGTIIDLAANAIIAFTIPNGLTAKRTYLFEDFKVTGNSVAGQKIWSLQDSDSQGILLAKRVNSSGIQIPVDITAGSGAPDNEPITINLDDCHFIPNADGSSILINMVNLIITVNAYMQRIRFYNVFEDAVTGTLTNNNINAGVNFLGEDNLFAVGTDCTVGALNLTNSVIYNFGPNPSPTVRTEDDNSGLIPSQMTGCGGAFVNFDFNGNGTFVNGGNWQGVGFTDNATSRFSKLFCFRSPTTAAVIQSTSGVTIVEGCFFNDHGTSYVLSGLISIINGNFFFASGGLAAILANEGECIITNNEFTSSGVNINAAGSGAVIAGNQYQTLVTPNVLSAGTVPMAECVSGIPTKGGIFNATQAVTIANSAVDTSLIGTGVGTKMAPTFWFTPGQSIRIKLNGFVSDTGTPTYTFNVKKNGVVIATVTKTFSGTVSNSAFSVEVIITCYTNGAGGTAWVQGTVGVEASTFNFAGLVNTATTPLNTTIGNTFDVSFQWGTADPANTITSTNVTFEAL